LQPLQPAAQQQQQQQSRQPPPPAQQQQQKASLPTDPKAFFQLLQEQLPPEHMAAVKELLTAYRWVQAAMQLYYREVLFECFKIRVKLFRAVNQCREQGRIALLSVGTLHLWA
jgi:hypothetical protein